jgi:hypothetical protein
VPAGSTSATFKVTTLPVLFSTYVTIASTYKDVTKTADLFVTPLIPLL